MRDKTHMEQVERWANYVKNNDDWKMKLKLFINSQMEIASRFYKSLGESEEGRKKLKRIIEERKNRK